MLVELTDELQYSEYMGPAHVYYIAKGDPEAVGKKVEQLMESWPINAYQTRVMSYGIVNGVAGALVQRLRRLPNFVESV